MPEFRAELEIGGQWIDITADVRQSKPISISRGRPNEAGGSDPGKATLMINNRHGWYSPRNAEGPFFGLLGRRNRLRVWVREGERYFWSPSVSGGGRARVASSAALDVTDDLDVAVEMALDRIPTRSSVGASQVNEVIARYNTTGTPGQRMWRLVLTAFGRPALAWSTDGDDFNERFGTAVVPYYSQQRFALRATLDVDDGAGGHVATFYTAPSLAGPWEQLGEPVTTAGTTSINQVGDASLEISNINTISFSPGHGRFYAAELRDGIDGPLLASPDFTVQAPGAGSFDDAQGNTWLIELAGRLVDEYRRCLMHVVKWPTRWDHSGRDRWVPLTAAGPLRSLSQGKKPLQSTLRRFIPTHDDILLAYWPMEDGSDTTQPGSALTGGQPMTTSGLSFGAADTLVSSAALPTITDGATLRAPLPALPAPADRWRVEMVYFLEDLPASETLMVALDMDGQDDIHRLTFSISASQIIARWYDSDGAVTDTSSTTDPTVLSFFEAGWSRFYITATPNGGQFDWDFITTPIGVNEIWGLIPTRSFFATPQRIRTRWGADLDGMPIGHVTYTTDPGTNVYGGGVGGADDAWRGERAITRARRLGEEERTRLAVVSPGVPADSQQVGPQQIATGLTLLTETADADGGVLHELRDWTTLQYLPPAQLYNRPVAVAFDQAAGVLGAPPEPVDDDQALINESTVTRRDGASATESQDTGRYAVDVIGPQDDAVTLNLATDDQAAPAAAWIVHQGTIDEERIPTVELNLRNPVTAAYVQQILDMVDVQSRIIIRNPPDGLQEDLDLIVESYTERISRTTWTMTLTCSPASAWTVGVVGDTKLGKVDTDGCETASPIDAADTLVPVVMTAGPAWRTDPAEAPWDIRAGGEVMTVNAVLDDPTTDTFERTETGGWGTADTGEAWTTLGGAAVDFSVGSGVGRHSVEDLNVNRYTLLPTIADPDFDVSVSISTPVLATGNNQQAYLVARYQDTANFYAARLDFTPDQEVLLTLIKIVAGAPFAFPAVDPELTHTVDTLYRLRFQGQGTQLRAKAWLDGDDEPDDWQVQQSDSGLTAAGQIGCRTRLLSGNTNTLPVVISFDDFAAPQLLEVVRSVNGVAKPHGAGADVRLAHPAIVAY